jgi:NADH-quinone oxidoreductase subunit N
MTASDLIALLPIIVAGTAPVVVMLVVAFSRSHRVTVILTLMGLLLAFALLPVASSVEPRQVTPLLILDQFALFYMGLILAASFGITALSYGYLEGREGHREEFYILMLLATLGAVVLVASRHFASFFIGLELLSVSLFALIAYPVYGALPLEASIKYLILAGFSSAFLLFGMALIYAELGTMEFARMSALLATEAFVPSPYWLMGLVMVITGVGFKLALVPFHMWTPDVYEGAPAPVTAYVATISKGAMFALLLRYFVEASAYRYDSILIVLSLVAIASMLIGNLLALLQNNIKRILAYSSIAHLGYLLVAFLAAGALAAEAVTFYLVFYFVTMLGAFGIVTLLSPSDRERDTDALEDYRGLFWRRPWLAAAFTGMLFSLAGIPLTVGFIGKFYVVTAAVNAALWLLATTLVIGSAIGLFYYLRIILVMYMPPLEGATEENPSYTRAGLWAGNLVLTGLTLLVMWLGVYPASLIRVIQTTAVSLSLS